MGRGINIALVNGNVTSCPKHLAVRCNWECFATFAALKHSWEPPLFLCFVLPTGRTGALIKTGVFDMWAGGALDLCSSSWGNYAHKWQSPSFWCRCGSPDHVFEGNPGRDDRDDGLL